MPKVKNQKWPRNDIDRFTLARLEQQGLKPNKEADRYTLIRRASLDLAGLPPTPQEVDAFLADKDPEAYEKLVDRLLARFRAPTDADIARELQDHLDLEAEVAGTTDARWDARRRFGNVALARESTR